MEQSHTQKMEAVEQQTVEITHDLNNVLAALLSASYILQKENTNKHLVPYINTIVKAGNETKILIDKLEFIFIEPSIKVS